MRLSVTSKSIFKEDEPLSAMSVDGAQVMRELEVSSQ